VRKGGTVSHNERAHETLRRLGIACHAAFMVRPEYGSRRIRPSAPLRQRPAAGAVQLHRLHPLPRHRRLRSRPTFVLGRRRLRSARLHAPADADDAAACANSANCSPARCAKRPGAIRCGSSAIPSALGSWRGRSPPNGATIRRFGNCTAIFRANCGTGRGTAPRCLSPDESDETANKGAREEREKSGARCVKNSAIVPIMPVLRPQPTTPLPTTSMELIRGQHNLQPHHRGCVATIGNFDGVHLGHQAILAQLAEQASRLRLPRLVITFEPQPQEFFTGPNAPPLG
jgi:hypothetical protein